MTKSLCHHLIGHPNDDPNTRLWKKTRLATALICLSTLLHAGFLAGKAQSALLINEIDYDQPGSDDAEFIELYNTAATAVQLDGISLELINGSNGSTYRSIALDGYRIAGGGFFVVCGDASQVANCDYSFTSRSGWLQNGAPDAVALLENGNIIDSISYEGALNPYTETASPAQADSNSEILSLSRLPNGFDSNNNLADFTIGCITPGSANISGVGDCSVPGVSAVPVPAAVWLLSSGLIGLVGLSRRRQAAG